MTVEMVLILTILIALVYLAKEKLFDPTDHEKSAFYQFITGPWKAVLVMMESGVWDTKRPDGRTKHPNNFKRMQSEKGITP